MTTTLTAAETSSAVHDSRSYYRKALAAVAPLPFIAMGLTYVTLAVPGDAPFATIAHDVSKQIGLAHVMYTLDMLFFAFLIPSVLAVAAVTQRFRPRLTAAALTLTVPGFALSFGVSSNDTQLAVLTHDKHLDLATMAALDKAWAATPQVGIASLLFIIGVVFGLAMLGIALWRSGAAPAWCGAALAIGGATHPFLPGHVAQGIGLLVAAAGVCGASVALLQMPDDDFAPAPLT